MPPPGNLPRRNENIRIIDLAFVKFERRLQACLDKASERIMTEAETAQAYVEGQLKLLRSSILKGLEDSETETVARRKQAVATAHTEPRMKRAWPTEGISGVPSTVLLKKSRYSDVGIEEARQELAAEKSARKYLCALERSVKKEQLLAEKDISEVSASKDGVSASDVEGSEYDLYSSASEGSASDGYKTPPSPTPVKSRKEAHTTLPGRKSDPRVSFVGAPIRGLQS